MFDIQRAQLRDVGTIWMLRSDRAEWIADRGSDQWSDAGLDQAEFVERVRTSIESGETWVLLDRGDLLGTIALDQWATPGLWSAEELGEALVVHRMITSRNAAGRGLGAELLRHADRIAATQGLEWIRLDAWTSNTALHRYYRQHGFRHVRTDVTHDSPSAALFERQVQAHHIESIVMQSLDSGVHLLPTWQIAGETPIALRGMTYPLQHGPRGWTWDRHPVTSMDGVLARLDPHLDYQVACYPLGPAEAVVVEPVRDADRSTHLTAV